jgi:hypothetical protein
MAVDSRVQKLIDEISDRGCTPEEVCVACPELLPEVRRRWQQMRRQSGGEVAAGRNRQSPLTEAGPRLAQG